MTENTRQKRVADVLIIHNASVGVNEVWQGLVTDAVRAKLMSRLENKTGKGGDGKSGAAPIIGATTGSAALALNPVDPAQNPGQKPNRSGGTGVLLVRTLNKAAVSAVPATDTGKIIWRLPGGRVEAGETSAQGAQREADEELGQGAVRVGRQLVEITEDDGTIATVFEGALNFDVPITVDGAEIAEYAWFGVHVAADQMNPLSANLFRAAMAKVEGAA